MRAIVGAAVVVGAALAGCAGGATGSGGAWRSYDAVTSSGGAGGAAAEVGARQQGYATWYSDSLAGRHTASGEPYDPARRTAAHRTLPLGTRVRVVRSDGRAVEVTVNDRGPFGSARRIIDLSRAAATELGMLRAGVVPVEIEVLEVGRGRRRARR